jgi:hypothetical protein
MQPDELENLENILDPTIKQVINTLREMESDYPEACIEGLLHYIITSVLAGIYADGGYKAVNDAVGVLECAKHAFLAASYQPGE